jgi:uncharacterized protein involved in exopolysaccharide biosynthesis
MRLGQDQPFAGLSRLGSALLRHRLMVAVVTLSALLASTAFVELTPARYRSEARLLVDTAPASAVVSASDLVSSQMQVLRSREIARRTIDRHGLGPSLAREVAAPAGFGLAEARAASVVGDALIDHWLGNLLLERDGQSPVVRISFEARDPALAARVANGIAETFIELQAQGLQTAASLTHGPARVMARAMPASEPSFPQPAPTIILSTLFAFVAAAGAALVQSGRPIPLKVVCRSLCLPLTVLNLPPFMSSAWKMAPIRWKSWLSAFCALRAAKMRCRLSSPPRRALAQMSLPILGARCRMITQRS